jgi:outer membrane protein
VFDFGQTTGSYHVAEANLGNTKLTEQAARLNLVLAVRTAYFKLSQQRALLEVAQETLANLKRHQQQIQGFVEVGARAPIDLVQSQADEQSGQLGLLNAESAYAIARASLAQTIGSKLNHDFDVVQEGLPAVAGEDGETATLLARAQAGHPQLQAALGAVRVQDLAEGTARGAYGPSLRVSAGVTESGEQLDALALNWNAQVLLNCPIFNGGQTAARVAEARANRESASAQVSVVTEQMRLAVEQARLGIRGSKFALSTAEVLVSLSRQRVNLAEGRYETGVGTLLELDDAVLKLASARAQQVQAVYNLAVARAQLLNALGVL